MDLVLIILPVVLRIQVDNSMIDKDAGVRNLKCFDSIERLRQNCLQTKH